jgi:hypothetical protein
MPKRQFNKFSKQSSSGRETKWAKSFDLKSIKKELSSVLVAWFPWRFSFKQLPTVSRISIENNSFHLLNKIIAHSPLYGNYQILVLCSTEQLWSPNCFEPCLFCRNRWLVIAIYGFILLGSIGFDFIFTLAGIQPLQVEAIWLCLLILFGHGLACWDFLTQPKAAQV